MTISQNPIRTTIFYGLICGLSYVPVNFALNYMRAGSHAICLTLSLFVAGYALLLSRWSRKPFLAIVFPLLLLFLTAFLVNSIAAFSLLALAVTSWIRSGICFRNPAGIRLVVELPTCIVVGVVVAVFPPGSVFAWALGVWMFFLIQSLYFVIFDSRAIGPEDQYQTDPFERASRQAEAVLSNL